MVRGLWNAIVDKGLAALRVSGDVFWEPVGWCEGHSDGNHEFVRAGDPPRDGLNACSGNGNSYGTE
jgi:hypothetical protein